MKQVWIVCQWNSFQQQYWYWNKRWHGWVQAKDMSVWETPEEAREEIGKYNQTGVFVTYLYLTELHKIKLHSTGNRIQDTILMYVIYGNDKWSSYYWDAKLDMWIAGLDVSCWHSYAEAQQVLEQIIANYPGIKTLKPHVMEVDLSFIHTLKLRCTKNKVKHW